MANAPMPGPAPRLRALAAVLGSLMWISQGLAALPEPGGELDRWFTGELAPWLTGQLTTHPRLRGEPLRVAVVSGEAVDPRPSSLSAGLRDRLGQLLLDQPGVVIAREPAAPDWQQPVPPKLDCRPSPARYLLALDIEPGSQRSRVRLRIMDLDERGWVAGFSRQWQGRLTRDELSATRRSTAVETLRGRRTLPFESAQPDLLAARLAYQLGCGVLAQPEDGLRVWVGEGAEAAGYSPAVRLVGNYLARAGLLRLAGRPEDADLVLSGRLHDVDGELKQLWVSLRPSAKGDLPSLEAAAYVRATVPADAPGGAGSPAPAAGLRQPATTGMPSPEVVALDERVDQESLNTLRVIRLPRPCRPGDCDARGELLDPSAGLSSSGPLALEATSGIQVSVFLLALRPGKGLERLAPRDCTASTGVTLMPGRRLRHALDGETQAVTMFAIAVDPRRDRRLARLLADVPAGCGGRPLRGDPLARWLGAFEAVTRERHVDWQAIRLTFNANRPGELLARGR